MNTAKVFYVKVAQLKDATFFFKDCLGMTVEDVDWHGKEKCVLVKHDDHTHLLLSEHSNQNQTDNIILRTPDCLENYCRLKAKGIHFKKTPVYLTEGLCIVFSDPFGNDYTLLEERSYTETQW